MMILSKCAVVSEMLTMGIVRLVIDGARSGVVAPDAWRSSPLILDIGHPWALEVPIPDLVVDEYGVSGTLSFNRTPHRVVIPWDALHIAVQGDEVQVAWPGTSDAAEPKPQPKRGGLSLVKP